jgi:Pyruvate/2-oxoacid:ferredoxin oxidoreductase delta subunit
MCVWCEQYSDGYERWYFNPANYARRLYKIRREEAQATGAEGDPQAAGGMSAATREYQEAQLEGDTEVLERIKKAAEDKAWRTHFGQVVTLDEVYKILEIMYPIGKMTCACRRSMRGLANEDNFTCIGLGPGMYKWERWPETYRGGVEFLDPKEAKDFLTKINKRGLVHVLFTFGTPYIGGLCNCDYPDCGAIRTVLDHDIKAMFKGHYVAQVDFEACNGCTRCVHRCQFRALNFSASSNLAFIDQFQCYGCGLCQSVCPKDAIKLVERASIPALANVW